MIVKVVHIYTANGGEFTDRLRSEISKMQIQPSNTVWNRGKIQSLCDYKTGCQTQKEIHGGREMKTCRVKPSYGECCMCADTTDFYNEIPNCSQCGYKTLRYELIEIVSGLLNDYAFVQLNGNITKVSLDRVYDIKEEKRDV